MRTPAAAGALPRVNDALLVIFGIYYHYRFGYQRSDSPCARNASSGNCGTCAAIHNSRGSSARAAWCPGPLGGPLGGGDAGRTRKTDGVALDPEKLLSDSEGAGSGNFSR